MPEDKEVKEDKKPFIEVTFDKEKDTHEIEIFNLSGKEMIIAYQSIGRAISDKTNMPIDIAIKMAIKLEKEMERAELPEKEEKVKDYFAKTINKKAKE